MALEDLRPCPHCGCASRVSELADLARKHNIGGLLNSTGSFIRAKQMEAPHSLMDACVKCGTVYVPRVGLVTDLAERVLKAANIVDAVSGLGGGGPYQAALDALPPERLG